MNISREELFANFETIRQRPDPKILRKGTDQEVIATHDVIASDVEAFLARGGKIAYPVAEQLRCEAAPGLHQTFDRRWKRDGLPITEHGDGLHHWRTKGRLTLPNSGEGKRPRAA